MNAEVSKSEVAGKKWTVVVEHDGKTKTIHFGDSSLPDYTTHNPIEREARKRSYLARHKVSEDWDNPLTAGFWSRWLLWNKTTRSASAKDIERKFHINVSLL